MNININEIFPSFDGEANKFGQGTPSIFIRFQGCNLRCAWCDTKYALETSEGFLLSIETILREVRSCNKGIKKVTITGGEPLLQEWELHTLVEALFISGYKISVETNGSKAWHTIDQPGISYVHSWLIDYKLSSSSFHKSMMPSDYYVKNTKEDDFIKFVIDDHRDFMEAVYTQTDLVRLGCRARFAYSTTTRYVSQYVLADWMMGKPEILDKAVFNVQLHKIVWPNERSR